MSILSKILCIFSPPGMAILSKELRTTARRKRYYALRFAYILLLGIFVVTLWDEVVGFSSYRMRISRMSELGRAIAIAVTWFQFIMIQLVAIALMSNSINGEIENRTYPALLTTPLTSWQIVVGKLSGRMVNLFLLVVLSLPMLMLTRLLGGVEWITILAGICITLTAGIFAAAITMFFSTITRKAWSCILCTLLTLGALYFLLPYLFFLLVDTADHGFAKRFFDSRSGATLSFIIHPYAALIIVVFTPISAPGKFAGIYKLWHAHCAYMLFVSLMILLWCAKRIRNVTAGRAIGSKFIDQEAVPVNANLITTSQSPTSIALPIKKTHASRINWHPMFRKELGKGLFRSGKTATLVLSGLLLLAGAFYLLLTAQRHGPDDFELNTMFTEVFLGLGALTLCIVASTVVSSERQSRTLELLLLTNISPGTIILSKCLGAIRKSLCIWVFLLGYVLIVVGSEQLHPIAILHVFMLAVSITILLTGSGIFFSTYFRTTSTAVILNLAFCLVLWVLVPLIAIIMMRRYESSHLAASHPFVLLASAIEGSSERGNYYWRGHVPGERYYFPGGQEISMAYMTWHVMVIMLWHCLAGFAMAALAASGLRNRAR